MNETTHRFLQAIVERLPEGRITELRLFPAIRQGGIESAVAVVAVEQPPRALVAAAGTGGLGEGAHDVVAAALDGEVAAMLDSPELPHGTSGDGTGGDSGRAGERVASLPFTIEGGGAERGEGVAAAGDEEEDGDLDADAGLLADSASLAAADATPALVPGEMHAADAPAAAGVGDPLRDGGEREVVLGADRVADAPAADATESVALGDILALPEPAEAASTPAPADDEGRAAITRYAILTAHYRLVLKGPDRGKWEVDIVHEADAPLDTLARVARGVARRAGDSADPEHFSGESLRHALEQPVWATTT